MGDNSVKIPIEAVDLFSSELKNLESQFLQVEKAGKKTSSTVSALFHSMDDEQFSVQATWQRAMDDVKKATTKAVNDANREIENLGKNVSSDRLASSFKNLNIKSALDIEREKARLIASFDAIKKSGVASADEIKRAEKALADQLHKIDGALDNNKIKANEATSSIATGLRGVVSWLASAFAIERVIAFTKASFEASLAVDAITSKLKIMTGSDAGAVAEWQYIRAEAHRLGLDLLQTADSYSTFAVATKDSAIEGKKTREVFSSMAEATTALHLPAEKAAAVMYQFQQMVSKGKVNMEDLRTASESFPGLMGMIAKSLNITTAELMSQMQVGKLMADEVLPKLAKQLHDTYGKAAEEAATKGRSALNRFKTEVFDFLQKFGKASEDNTGAALGWATQFVTGMKEGLKWVQSVKIEFTALTDKFFALVDNGGFVGLLTGGSEARKDLKEQFLAIDAMAKYSQDKLRETNQNAADQQLSDDATNGQRRRDNAKKTGEDLAKINVEYAKQTGNAEAQLTADIDKQYEERKKSALAFYNQKKAYAKDDGEEAAWEQLKNNKLKEIEQQHSRDIEIIKAQSRSAQLSGLKEQVDLETLFIREKMAKNIITTQQGEQQITLLTIAAAKAQYDAKKAVVDTYVSIYGKQGEDYKKLLKDEEDAHKSYLSANLSAYKTYADNIKAIDQQIKDFRQSIQDKIRAIQQKGMTDAQKYADTEMQYREAQSKAAEALAQKDYETAEKYNKKAIELAEKLADKPAAGNTELEKEQALKDGIQNATNKLNESEQQGLQILEAKKQANQDALTKLEQIRDMKLDPKNLAVNLDQGALAAVRSEIAALTADATKTITVVYKSTGSSGEASYSDTGATGGYFAGGKITNGSPLKDSVNAMLARNEWVINNKATGFWGDQMMAAINAPFSSAGQRLQMMVNSNGATPANVPHLGNINLNIGGGSFPVQANVDVIAQLDTALRRMKRSRPQ